MRRLLLLALLALLATAPLVGQTLSVSSTAGSPGGATALTISLTSPAGSSPAGLQWTLNYNPADIASISVAPGPSAVAAAKSVHCSSAVGAHSCVAIGMNGNAITNGSVATVNVTLTGSAATTAVRLTNTLGASASGNPITLSGGSGTITVQNTAGGGTAGGTTGGTTAFSPIRVNAGGPAYTDDAGQVWAADKGSSGGNIYSVNSPIAGTKNAPLYQTLRWHSGTFQYQFPVPNGVYTVNLKFAEVYFTQVGQRRFSTLINGQTALFNFDVVAAAGGPCIAIDRSFQTTVTNGLIMIQFAPGDANYPQISAIEITATGAITVGLTPAAVTLGRSQSQQFSAAVKGGANSAVTWSLSAPLGTVSGSGLYTAPAVLSVDQQITVTARSVTDSSATASATVNLVAGQAGFVPIRVNAGGPAYTDPQGQTWSADTGATNGQVWESDIVVENTSTPKLYKTKRWDWDRLGYRFSVPNGTYTVTLKFAEIWFKNPGQRVFDVTINGQRALANFDIVAQAGGPNRAVDKAVRVNVTDGVIAIEMISTVDEPQINAIEIVQ